LEHVIYFNEASTNSDVAPSSSVSMIMVFFWAPKNWQ